MSKRIKKTFTIIWRPPDVINRITTHKLHVTSLVHILSKLTPLNCDFAQDFHRRFPLKIPWGGWRTCLRGWGQSSVLGLWGRTWRLIVLPQKCSFMLLNSCNSVSGFSIEAIFPLRLSLSPKITTAKGAIRTYGGVISPRSSLQLPAQMTTLRRRVDWKYSGFI